LYWWAVRQYRNNGISFFTDAMMEKILANISEQSATKKASKQLQKMTQESMHSEYEILDYLDRSHEN
jgi:hypothetical protein